MKLTVLKLKFQKNLTILKWNKFAAVKAANPFFKTGPCKEFQNGACNYGNFADVEGGHPTNWCGKIHLLLPQRL